MSMNFDLTYGGPMDRYATVHTAGEVAYIDTMQGLVPVKVLEVITPGRGWVAAEGNVRAVVTETRGAFHKGYVTDYSAARIIPKKHVIKSNLHPRIDTNYRWDIGTKPKSTGRKKNCLCSSSPSPSKRSHNGSCCEPCRLSNISARLRK